MGMMDQIVKDVKRITGDASGGFAIPMTFSTKDGSSSVTINGIHSKIHLGVDTEGNFVNSVKAHISVSEIALNEAGYVTRDAKNECILKDHRVTLIDITTNVQMKYSINQVFPDETTGLIVCILGNFK